MQTDSKFGCAKYTLGTNILIKILNFLFFIFSLKDGSINFTEFITALSITSRGSLDEKLECEYCLHSFFFSFHKLPTQVKKIYYLYFVVSSFADWVTEIASELHL